MNAAAPTVALDHGPLAARDLSVIVLSLRGSTAANATLRALAAELPAGSAPEIFVVLGGAITAELGGPIDLVDPLTDATIADAGEPLDAAIAGFLERAAGEWLLFVSDDLALDAGWLAATLDHLHAHPDVNALSPAIQLDGAHGGAVAGTAGPSAGAGVCLLASRAALLEGRVDGLAIVETARAQVIPPAPPTKRQLGVAAHLIGLASRRALFAGLHDLASGRGLEIGPLDSGLADPELHDVRYVDVRDRAGTQATYADDPNVILDLIPEIDFPLYDEHGDVRTLAEAAAPGAPYDWTIASHVIEHVPDLIGWLAQIAELTRDGGALVLAVPDRRYCFDRHRVPTTTGEALTAYEERRVKPNTRAIYDCYASQVPADTVALWNGDRPAGRGARYNSPQRAMELVEKGRHEYVDAHVWTFTPQAFLEQVKDFRALGLCAWYVDKLIAPEPSIEFFAVLRRIPRGADPTTFGFVEPELDSDLPDWLDHEWRLRAEVIELRVQLAAERARADALEQLLAVPPAASR